MTRQLVRRPTTGVRKDAVDCRVFKCLQVADHHVDTFVIPCTISENGRRSLDNRLDALVYANAIKYRKRNFCPSLSLVCSKLSCVAALLALKAKEIERQSEKLPSTNLKIKLQDLQDDVNFCSLAETLEEGQWTVQKINIFPDLCLDEFHVSEDEINDLMRVVIKTFQVSTAMTFRFGLKWTKNLALVTWCFKEIWNNNVLLLDVLKNEDLMNGRSSIRYVDDIIVRNNQTSCKLVESISFALYDSMVYAVPLSIQWLFMESETFSDEFGSKVSRMVTAFGFRNEKASALAAIGEEMMTRPYLVEYLSAHGMLKDVCICTYLHTLMADLNLSVRTCESSTALCGKPFVSIVLPTMREKLDNFSAVCQHLNLSHHLQKPFKRTWMFHKTEQLEVLSRLERGSRIDFRRLTLKLNGNADINRCIFSYIDKRNLGYQHKYGIDKPLGQIVYNAPDLNTTVKDCSEVLKFKCLLNNLSTVDTTILNDVSEDIDDI